jgi:hypothetical protein
MLLAPAAPVNPAAKEKAVIEKSTSKAQAEAQAHLASCSECATELAALQSTFALLDMWPTLEVSPYFDQKLAVSLREEQAAPAAGWFEQLRSRLLFNTGRQFRPVLVTAMAVVLLVGGGGIGVSTISSDPTHATPMVEPSAAVNDLQILDKNEQAIQQMDQLLQEDGGGDDKTAPQPAS